MQNLFKPYDQFQKRHIGINERDCAEMLQTIGVKSLDELIDQTVPSAIRSRKPLHLPDALTEFEYLKELKETANLNKVFTNFIGQGYFGTITPAVLLRNIFQNPGWYTQYTPYQAEIAQGRLEALLNYQTMVSDLTGLPIANASLLDEATAAAEAMVMFFAWRNKKVKDEPLNDFIVSDKVLPATIDVLKSRAKPLKINVIVANIQKIVWTNKTFGILLQYPNMDGAVEDYRALTAAAAAKQVYVTVATDLLSLALLQPPGEWGADAVVGNSQRFGVPMGFGGPHAAFFATKDEFKRVIAGRIIGVSTDVHGKPALRMALQTREQHIRREKATSNICTAQALLAIMAGMYAAYHGQAGIKAIAERVHQSTIALEAALARLGFKNNNINYFDTLQIIAPPDVLRKIQKIASDSGVNFNFCLNYLTISLDETHHRNDLEKVVKIFAQAATNSFGNSAFDFGLDIPKNNTKIGQPRTTPFLTHPVFNSYHTETEMMRYLKQLETKDLSLTHSMISLGSCTMKLNAAAELLPVSWEAFANIHPYAPARQTKGYLKILHELEQWLCECTGFDACSLQPNSGAQGEYAGLLVIQAYHEAKGDMDRKVALIPSSAHGTNPASAVMAGMEVVVVACDEKGNIDVTDLTMKADIYAAKLSCLMVTYPSTHGVFETEIKTICKIIHDRGGKVYMDGANMNAQVGLTSPGKIGADVCHLNLHKTFAIPHGGGGPGMGPICVNKSLAPYLPSHPVLRTGGRNAIKAISAAPYGSASILLISYGYIKMLGNEGVTNATKYAILNANYIKARLEGAYSVLFSGENGRAAHELILDLRPFKALVSAEDVAKRLPDYGFHAPTLSFPVAGTIMIEPTESESKAELDRFCDALLEIRNEIDEIAAGKYPLHDNVLSNAPHPCEILTADEWKYPYSRSKAAYPLAYLRSGHKFWASVGRVNNAAGDRNLICTCPPIESYSTASAVH
jgi:glycine dehydrogenase